MTVSFEVFQQVHWFDQTSRQKESKQKNKQVIQPSTTVNYEKLPSRCTDFTQQAGRKNKKRRTSKLFNHPQRSTTKSFQAGALILPSKQAERIKREEQASYSTIHNGRLRKASKQVHWFNPAGRQKESKQKDKQVIQPSTTVDYKKLPSRCTDLTQQAGRKNQSKRTSKLFNHPQRSTTKSFQVGAHIWPNKQAERIKAKEQASYSTIHNSRLRKASKQLHWFDPARRQKESEQNTDLTQQAGRKKESKRTCKLFNHPQWSTKKSFQACTLIWPSKQAERIKREEQATNSTIHNGRLRKAPKQAHWFDPAGRQKESKQKNKQVIQPSTTVDYEKLPSRCTDLTQQAGRKNQSRRLIWPSKQAERIKAKEHASYSTIHNGRQRKASKQVHWFDPASRQEESKQKNKQVIQPFTPVDYKNLPSRCTNLTSKQAERIKAEEHSSYSSIHNGRQRKASKQVHWFDPARSQKESKQKTDLTQQAGRKNQSRRTSK